MNADGRYRSFGPEFKATTGKLKKHWVCVSDYKILIMLSAGEIWPKPYQQVESNKYYAVNTSNFQFIVRPLKFPFLWTPNYFY